MMSWKILQISRASHSLILLDVNVNCSRQQRRKIGWKIPKKALKLFSFMNKGIKLYHHYYYYYYYYYYFKFNGKTVYLKNVYTENFMFYNHHYFHFHNFVLVSKLIENNELWDVSVN
jgi:hypothetical protein